MNKTIGIVAGKSGGHILPGLTIAQQLLHEKAIKNVIFFSTTASLDYQLLKNQKYITRHIALPLHNVPRNPLYLFKFTLQLVFVLLKGIFYIKKYQITHLISMGGYISIPVCFAAWIWHIPIEIYELNVIPGKATRFLAPFTSKINICFARTATYLPAHKCTLTSYPLRTKNTPSKQKLPVNFSSERKTILILGGSQGSIFINSCIKKWLEFDPKFYKKVQIIHQTGPHDIESLQKWYQQIAIPALAFSYNPEISFFYQYADLIICRAGAGTLFEVIQSKKPCISIPLETPSTGHQVQNAYAMQEQYPQQFIILRQHELKTNPQISLSDSIKMSLKIGDFAN